MLVGDLEPSISMTALQGERRTSLCLEGISEAHGLLKFRGPCSVQGWRGAPQNLEALP